MERRRTTLEPAKLPLRFRPFLDGAVVYDSSCSRQAQVWFLDKGPGYYLKTAPKGTLRREAELTAFFYSKGLAAEVVGYESLQADWLLTVRVPGEDCIFQKYLDDPVRLCDTIAEQLRMLHDTDPSGCPVPNRTAEYLETARRNREAGHWDLRLFGETLGFADAEEAWHAVETGRDELETNTLLHGDYCLPNIMLDDWKFSGFIDLDTGGVGDRHVDLFWGVWSLQYNLKTDRYGSRFLDAYGRDRVCEERFRTIAAIEIFG